MDEGDQYGKTSNNEYPCLVRVTDGKKAHFSTHVRSPCYSTQGRMTQMVFLGSFRRLDEILCRLRCASQSVFHHSPKAGQKA